MQSWDKFIHIFNIIFKSLLLFVVLHLPQIIAIFSNVNTFDSNMKYVDLEGNEHNLNLSNHLGKPQNKSSLHLKVRQFLKDFLPMYQVYEECPVNVTKKKVLYLDFFIPSLKVILESDGLQHKVFTPFFHRSKANFLNSRKNDRLKENWAGLNDFVLLRFDDSQTESDWKTLLNS